MLDAGADCSPPAVKKPMTYLDELEAESIHIMREVAAEFRNPVMLYSIGKDSSSCCIWRGRPSIPSKLPFPLLHIDTGWKFREMIAFPRPVAETLGVKLLIHTNAEGRDAGVTPFTHGSSFYTTIMKTDALKQALTLHGFDAAFGGARRDEEKSRAKERIFSFRNQNHVWEPKNQRPELWNLFNTRIHKGESIRVFPLSNWTELDIWRYIQREKIEIVPLYFAAPRPVVSRNGQLILVDDERLPLEPGEQPDIVSVRFRTLGCYPLSAAVPQRRNAPRPHRGDDAGADIRTFRPAHRSRRTGSMEKKKREGYF